MNSTTSGHLLSPITHNIFLGMDTTLITPLVCFHYLMRSMLKRESKKKGQNLIKNLLEGYIGIIPGSFIVIAIYVNVLTIYLEPPATWIGPWFCIIFELFGHWNIVYIGGFSFWSALLKYWFIVHSKQALVFGEEKARKLVFAAHVLVPVFLSCLNSITNGKADQIFWVDHCWGHMQSRRNLENNDTSNVVDNLLCVNRNYDLSGYLGDNVSNVVKNILRTTCGSLKFLYLLFLSNMVEFILYVLIFRYLNRYIVLFVTLFRRG